MENNILAVLLNIDTTKDKTVDVVTSADNNLQLILKENEDKKKRKKADKDDEKKRERWKKQLKKRQESDSKGGILGALLGNKGQRKRQSKELNVWTMAALGVAGAAGLAIMFKDEIGKGLNVLKDIVGKAIGDFVTKLVQDIKNWASKKVNEAANAASEPLRGLQEQTGGQAQTKGGTQFAYSDVVELRNKESHFMAQSGQYSAERRALWEDVLEVMREKKDTNDKLWNKQEELRKAKETSASAEAIAKIEQEISKLEEKKAELQQKTTDHWAKLYISDNDLIAHQIKTGKRQETPEPAAPAAQPTQAPVARQTGGPIDVPGQGSGDKVPMTLPSGSFVLNKKASAEYNANVEQKSAPSGKQIDVRTFSTTGYADGLTVKKQGGGIIKRQDGGLVLYKGHGDVPPGSGIAPGTDGPGTDIQGKFKPTAEQYFVDKVATAAENLAKKEDVALKYQRPTGYYRSASEKGANWQMIKERRRQGGAAVELHFDAYGMQNGSMIEGARGMLTNGAGTLSPLEKGLVSKFGTHPSNGTRTWGALMLELDSVKYAQSRVNEYARMLVDTVKGKGGGYSAVGTQQGGTTSSSGGGQQRVAQKKKNNNLMTGLFGNIQQSFLSALGPLGSALGEVIKFFQQMITGSNPGGTGGSTEPKPTQTEAPTPGVSAPVSQAARDIAKKIMESTNVSKAQDLQGLKVNTGEDKAKPSPMKYQKGGIVGIPNQTMARFNDNTDKHLQHYAQKLQPHIVRVKRSTPAPPVVDREDPMGSGGSGDEVNMVELSRRMHRVSSGARY